MILRPCLILLAVSALAACSKPAEEEAPVVVVAGAWCRAAPNSAPTGGCYATLTSSVDDRLTGVESNAAERGEVHAMDMTGGVMRMKKLDDGVELPAGQAVDLKPGGMHVMLIGPKAPLMEGVTLPVTFKFAKAPAVTVNVPVQAPPGASHDMAGH